MAKTTLEKIESKRIEMKQLQNETKLLIQKNKEEIRKARTKRLCSRGGYLESRLPETITLTDEQYKSFLEKTLFSEYARKILNGLTRQNAETASTVPAEMAAQSNATPANRPAIIDRGGNAGEGNGGGNGETATG